MLTKYYMLVLYLNYIVYWKKYLGPMQNGSAKMVRQTPQ